MDDDLILALGIAAVVGLGVWYAAARGNNQANGIVQWLTGGTPGDPLNLPEKTVQPAPGYYGPQQASALTGTAQPNGLTILAPGQSAPPGTTIQHSAQVSYQLNPAAAPLWGAFWQFTGL